MPNQSILNSIPRESVVAPNGFANRSWLGWFQAVAQAIAGSWKPYTPTVTGLGLSGLTVNAAEYRQLGNILWLRLDLSFTTATAGASISATLPIAPSDSSSVLTCAVTDGALVAGLALATTGGLIVQRSDGANWGLGAGRRVQVTGAYRV